jgi:antitoxin component YwqK of YwqJK toxin-antitoxin module
MAARPKATKHTHYHKDGSVWAKGYMQGGKMHGHWEWFRKDGTKMRSGDFDQGTQTGRWITYDKKGKIYKVTVMKGKA